MCRAERVALRKPSFGCLVKRHYCLRRRQLACPPFPSRVGNPIYRLCMPSILSDPRYLLLVPVARRWPRNIKRSSHSEFLSGAVHNWNAKPLLFPGTYRSPADIPASNLFHGELVFSIIRFSHLTTRCSVVYLSRLITQHTSRDV